MTHFILTDLQFDHLFSKLKVSLMQRLNAIDPVFRVYT